MKDTWQFFKDHWLKLVPLVALVIGSIFGVQLIMQKGPAGSDPKIIVVIPEQSTPAEPSFLGPANSSVAFAAPQRAGLFDSRKHLLVRAHLAVHLHREKKISLEEAFARVRKISADELEVGMATAAASQADGSISKQLGDGTLIKQFFEWLKSPEGQQFLALLFKLLLGALMASLQQLGLDPQTAFEVACLILQQSCLAG